MLTTKELARVLGVAPRTLDNWRSASRGPAYFRFEHVVRYRMSDVEAWLAAQKVETLEALVGGRTL
ncbi:helix-turn-helix domain-containing protein [Actinomyces sp. 594]|uniref:helix-turn-helix transcriptional regulator n=1 Tax=Actinomyces sp. 594 TaxID=2057793 RepID=UPI001C5A3B5A|nr:helix-turn-helix domain-containing protein [Actinomyces sp. 594]MBW3068990.1 helix-turn-helix domain-containing protein [Actinomyces sp. 594]